MSRPASSPADGGLPADHPAPGDDRSAADETYFRIWQQEQAHATTRWTVATFFLSVSFAIFGFSFQTDLVQPLPQIARVSGLVIYWFAVLVFAQFNAYTTVLRAYLRELEEQQQTSLTVQTRMAQHRAARRLRAMSTTQLLRYFGIIYALGVGWLWWRGL